RRARGPSRRRLARGEASRRRCESAGRRGDRGDSCGREGEAGEAAFERGAAVFEPRRELESGAKRVRRLVHGETGPVRGDLEEDAAGLAEVDRAEVLPVADLGRDEAGAAEGVGPGALRLVVR